MDTDFVETELNSVKLRVFKNGTIMRWMKKSKYWQKIGAMNSKGYYVITLNTLIKNIYIIL